MKNRTNFKQLLWESGFIVRFASSYVIDKRAASDYLCCSLRTLDRWILDNNPCPRALKLLQKKEKNIPKSWTDFYFTQDDKLMFKGARNGYTASEIRQLPYFFSQALRCDTDSQHLTSLINELRDNDTHQYIKLQLIDLSEQLLQLANTSVFDDVKRAKQRINLVSTR